MNRAATIALAPFSLVYGAAVKIRSAFYRKGIFRTYKVAAPVISVGNITAGGTGKTPLVLWIAKYLAERGHRVCVLTRGYGRKNPNQRVVVSNGSDVLSDVERAGDEALMMAESLLGQAAVVCDADRVSAARWALENFESNIFILDDGFQHRRLVRDLNVVAIDATKPWDNGWLLPAGLLREPISSLTRADCLILTRAPDGADARLVRKIREVTDAPVLSSKMAIQRIRLLDSIESRRSEDLVRGQAVAAFCGIGNPRAFFQQLREQGFDLRHGEAFRDHHKYSQTDIDGLTRQALDSGADALVTTAKDAVKLQSLRFTLPCYVAEIDIDITEANRLLKLIDEAIQPKHSELRSQRCPGDDAG